MNKAFPVVLALLALTGCMKSYPLWSPPAPQAEESSQSVSVTVEGRVVDVDTDDESLELELTGEDSDNWRRVEFGSNTVVFPATARDRSVRGTDGLEMIEEDDTLVVSGLKIDDDVIHALEVSIGERGEASVPVTAPTAPRFEPRARVDGIIRAIDTVAGRLVLETDGSGLVAFYGDGDTPVFFKGVIYQIPSLEVGDEVTVTIGATDEGDPATPWITAIDVSRSVSHSGPARAPAANLGRVAVPDVTLDTIELTGVIKRVEPQGFEIEAEGGALRYVTVDPNLRVECGSFARASGLEAGVMVSLRALEVGDRVVAQQINCLGRAGNE